MIKICIFNRLNCNSQNINIQTCPNVHIFAHSFVHLQNVLINPNRAKTQKGGEELFQVIGQTIDEEDLKLQ
jgi:hypothetical protein